MTDTDDAPDADRDPFECPRCGGSVRSHGSGRRECTECPWDYRPSSRDSASTGGWGEQTGITDY